MKRTIFFSLIFLLLCSQTIIAQKSIYQQSFYQLRLATAVVGIENVVITDALDASNKIVHTASFDMLLLDNESSRLVLSSFQNKMATPISIYTCNINREISEEKVYTNVTVQEIVLPALNASDRSVVKATVKISAGTVEIVKAGGKALGIASKGYSNTIVSNFRVVMGILPCNKIYKLTSVSIRPGDKLTQNLNIEMSAVDATQWNEWFLTGAGGVKKEQGYIQLLAPDLRGVMYTIQLTDVDIVSFSISSATSAPQAMQRATIGLRVRKVSIK